MSNPEDEIYKFLKSFKQVQQKAISLGIDVEIDVDLRDLDELKNYLGKVNSQAKVLSKQGLSLSRELDKLVDRVDDLQRAADLTVNGGVLEGTNKLAKRIDISLGGDLPQKEAIKQAIEMLQAYQTRAFAITAAKPHRLPQLEGFEGAHIQELSDNLNNLLGSSDDVDNLTALVDKLDFANLTDQQQDAIQGILQKIPIIEDSIGGVVKGTKVIDHAYTEFFEGKNLRERTVDLREKAKEAFDAFRSVETSGKGIANSVNTLFKFASQAAFNIATENERRRHREGEEKINPLEAKRVHKLVTAIGNTVQANFDQIDKILRLTRNILFPATLAVELLFKAFDEGAKSAKQVVELFGAQTIDFGFNVNPQDFLSRIRVMNDALNSVDADLNVTFQDRLDIFREFIRSGGSVKALDPTQQEWFSDTVIRDLHKPVTIAATYENLLGKSRSEIGALLGKYTFESRMSFGQLEELFSQVSVLKLGQKITNTSVVLDSVLEVTDKFGNILGAARYNFALLSKIAKRTGLNEQQASRLLSGFLSYIEGIDIDASNKLITLAGYRFDDSEDMQELKASLVHTINQVRSTLVVSRDQELRNTEQYDAVQGQIDRLDFSKGLIAGVSIQYGITSLARDFPQALIPLVLRSVDGQIDLIFGKRSEFYKSTAGGYNAALNLIAEPLGLNDEMIQMLIAARFEKSGALREGEFKISDLELSISPLDDIRAAMRAKAAEIAVNVRSSADLMQQSIDGLKAKFIGLLMRFANLLGIFPKNYQTFTEPPIVARPAPSVTKAIPNKVQPLFETAKKSGVSEAALGVVGLVDRAGVIAKLVSKTDTFYTYTKDGKKHRIIDVLSDVAKKQKLPLATLMALFSQESSGEPNEWTQHLDPKSPNYGLFSVQMKWGGWDLEQKRLGRALTEAEKIEIALDPEKIAPIVAAQIGQEIEEVRGIILSNPKWKNELKEFQIQALGATRHVLPLLKQLLESLKANEAAPSPLMYKRYNTDPVSYTFTPTPRKTGESSFDFIQRNVTALFADTAKNLGSSNTEGVYEGKQTLGSSYFDNMLISEAFSIQETAKDSTTFKPDVTLGLTLDKTAVRATTVATPPTGRSGPLKTPQPNLAARGALVLRGGLGVAPPLAPAVQKQGVPALPFRLDANILAGGIVGKDVVLQRPLPSTSAALPYVINRTVNYETLYLYNLQELKTMWQKLANS